ncbi:DUF2202 domain-containing protein [Draconibacterium sp.]|nr:DUF2202 domain-containing protein [Draconibacterium sp.]
MKTRKLTIVLSLAFAIIFFVSCNETINNIEDAPEGLNTEKSVHEVTPACDSCTFSGTLTEAEIAGLLEMREEEKLARDVYIQLYEIHNHVVFNNISKAENVHMSAVLHLMNGYGLEDPALPDEGDYSNPLFTNLYKQLTEQGARDLIAALKVGAFIEEYDIADLKKLIDETDNSDIKQVYGNLLRGSEFHLRAFSYSLKQQGATYEPTIISEEEYQEILNSSNDSETEDIISTVGDFDGTGPNA